MNTNVTSHDALVDNYLRAVGDAMAGVPAYRRDELLQDLREHIAAGRAEFGDDETEAQVRSLLDQLGDPAEVADEARIDAPFESFERAGSRPPAPPMQLQPSKRVGAGTRRRIPCTRLGCTIRSCATREATSCLPISLTFSPRSNSSTS